MVGGLKLGRWNVAAGRVEALVVPPGHPCRGRELDLVGRPPGPLGSDELGLVEAVDRLGEGVVEAVALRAHRGDGSLVGQSIRVPDREVLDNPDIAVVDEPGEISRPPAPVGEPVDRVGVRLDCPGRRVCRPQMTDETRQVDGVSSACEADAVVIKQTLWVVIRCTSAVASRYERCGRRRCPLEWPSRSSRRCAGA